MMILPFRPHWFMPCVNRAVIRTGGHAFSILHATDELLPEQYGGFPAKFFFGGANWEVLHATDEEVLKGDGTPSGDEEILRFDTPHEVSDYIIGAISEIR